MRVDQSFITQSFTGSFQQSKRIISILQQSFAKKPHLNIERARYFTQALKQNEEQPMPLRWARAMVNVMDKMDIHILVQENIVGRFGSQGRYGVFYPELEGSFFAIEDGNILEKASLQYFTQESIEIIYKELRPYWRGRTYKDGINAELSQELKNLMYTDESGYSPSFIIQETATLRHSLQWVLDYEKILQHGFIAIENDARHQISKLSAANNDKLVFYSAVIELCQGIKRFSERYAKHAEFLASHESRSQRQEELMAIAERCRRVPYYSATNFVEAIQSQWFVQFISRIEQLHGGNISNGRIDQYLWPFYERDIQNGSLTKEQAKEYLHHLWCNMSQILRLQTTTSGDQIYENSAHWESTTIGGQKSRGEDATNELSYLVLETAMSFPLDYPYICIRIHENTPKELLSAVASALRQGKGLPFLMNDEEIIPLLMAKGVTEKEARNYTPSGYSEVRLVNRSSYLIGSTWLNLVAVLEMALLNGKCSSSPHKRIGLETGEAEGFTTFEMVKEAFWAQLTYVQNAIFSQQYIAERIRRQYLAFPFLSSMHSLCMKHGMDICSERVPESVNFGGFTGVTGLATVVDSLVVVKRLVFDEKRISMSTLLDAVAVNFEGYEDLRQLCLHCPKYGTGDKLTITLAKEIDFHLINTCLDKRNYYGGVPEIFYVPVTSHTAMGRVSNATPDGRRAGEELSCGTSATQGAANLGPTMLLATEHASKNPQLLSLGARVVDLSFSPRTVQGKIGLNMLCSLIQSWCKQKHWYLRIYIQNQKDLALIKNNPEKCRDIPIREPGLNGSHNFANPSIIQNMFVASKTEKNDGSLYKMQEDLPHAK